MQFKTIYYFDIIAKLDIFVLYEHSSSIKDSFYNNLNNNIHIFGR